MRKRILLLATGTVFAVGASAPGSAQPSDRTHSVIVRPHARVACRTLGEWSALWWSWAFSFPVNDNPLLDTSGEKAKFGDVGRVFFLGGLFNASGSVTRTATVPAKKYIFFPVLNLVNDNVRVSPRVTIDELIAQIEAAIPSLTDFHASIDGIPVTGQ